MNILAEARENKRLVDAALARIAALEAQLAETRGRLNDALSGLRYIEETHGRLAGVGWDRLDGYRADLRAGSAPNSGAEHGR